MKRRLLAVSCLLAVMLSAIAPAPAEAKHPEALNYASADAAVIVVVPNLAQANTRLAAFFKSIGIEDPQAQDPLNTMLAQVGAVAGVDADGSAALVMPDLQFMGEPPMYLVLPITDQQQFMGGFASVQAVEGMPDVHMAVSPVGETIYLRVFGNYAVVGNDAVPVAAHAGAADGSAIINNMGVMGLSSADRSDVYICLNLGKVGPLLQPLVAMGLAQWQMQLMNSPEMAAQMGGPEAAQAVVAMYGQLATVILTESQAMVMGLEFPEAGPSLSMAMQFKPQTGAAKVFAATPNSKLDFDRLPNKPYWFAMVMDNQAMDMQPLVDGINNVLLPQTVEGTPMHTMMQAYAKSLDMSKMFKEFEVACYVPEASDEPAELLNLACVYSMDDPAAGLQQYRETLQQSVAAQPAGPMQMSYSTDVDQLDGRPVDELVYDMSQVPGIAGNPILGQGKFTVRISTIEGAMIVATAEPGLTKVAEAATGGTGGLSDESLAATRQNLPEARFFEAYLNPGTLISMIMAAEMGGSEQQEMPAMPPLAMSGCSGSGGVALNIHAPTALILGIKQFAEVMSGAGMYDEEWSEEEWTEEEWSDEDWPEDDESLQESE